MRSSIARRCGCRAAVGRSAVDALVTLHRFDLAAPPAGLGAPRSRCRTRSSAGTASSPRRPSRIGSHRARRCASACSATRRPRRAARAAAWRHASPATCCSSAGRLTGFIDWELAAIGSPPLDVGWLMMMADAARAGRPDWCPVCPMTPLQIAAALCRANGAEPVGDLAWYQALAGYAARRDHLPQRASAPQRPAARRGVGAFRHGGEPDVLARAAHP